ncbi:MAG: hypothetical protein U0836_01980 [Pirellulales bacterium]
MPLKKAVLFNSGVGFFERSGKVAGDAELELQFNAEDINDLLKSMVLQDLGGGKISAVTYSSRDPVTKTLKTFAIDLTSNPTLAQLLAQIRGEKVELEAPNALSGLIVGVEVRSEPTRDGGAVEREFLTLLTDDGLRSVPLASVGRIKLADPKLDAELRQALAILALGHATDKKSVKLEFKGQGNREVRVGYIQESPIWKTSYRLVLDDKGQPLLQGWAIVENTTEEDWNDVRLTLVSGRPISFLMDLYQPLYVQRPMVQPELYASLGPVVYGQDLSRAAEEFRRRDRAVARGRGQGGVGMGGMMGGGMMGGMGGMGMGGGGFGGRGGAGYGRPGRSADDAEELSDEPAPPQEAERLREAVDKSVASVAQADDVGELFQYVIAAPVDLPRQQSALLPIVNQAVEAKKLSIYNQSVQSKHPLNGLRLKNTTDLHLMQGPITVFDDGAYAGDAKIEDLQPGTERLISYALDLDVEVAPEGKTEPERLRKVSIVKGTLNLQEMQTRRHKFVVKNSADESRTLLIEYPIDPQWRLVAPQKPLEKTRSLYRFELVAAPGKPQELSIEEEQTLRREVAISDLDHAGILLYESSPQSSSKVKQALQEVIHRRQEIDQAIEQRRQLEARAQEIGRDQARIRQNMAQLGRDTDLYRRYVKKFGEQEDQVEKLHTEIDEAQKHETSLREAHDAFLVSLDAE